MTAAALAAATSPASSKPASYPPRDASLRPTLPSSPPDSPTARMTELGEGGSRSSPSPVLFFLVNTATESITDLRLQVTQDPHFSEHLHTAFAARHALQSHRGDARGVPKPLWVKQRELTANEEIMDRIIDAETGKTSWTIHRPTRGWYLHIRSPNLPLGFSIPLRPARADFVATATGVHDPTSTPLAFSLKTKVNPAALKRCRGSIQEARRLADVAGGSSHRTGEDRSSQSSESNPRDFVAVELDMISHDDKSHSGHVARTSSVSYALQSNHDTHSRKRSTAGLATEEMEGQIGTTATRLQSLSGDTRVRADVAACERSSDEPSEAGGSSTEKQQRSTLRLPLSSSQQTASPQVRPDQARQAVLHEIQPQPLSEAIECYFLLLDGAGAFPAVVTRPSQSVAPQALGRAASQGSGRLSWASWIWSIVPEPIRPPLAFDTTKSFSVRWLDVHDNGVQEGGGLSGSTSRSMSGACSSSSIEVMRYEDENRWSLWNTKTRGRFVFQKEAVRALGIDISFWVTIGLAYLEFLEERDGYKAASDG